MSSDKIFVNDGASLIESEILGLDTTDSIKEATHLVNVEIQSLVAKTIIINLPLEFNFKRIRQFNKFIIRFPVKRLYRKRAKYNCIYYKLDKIEEVEDDVDISCLILNKHLLSNKEKMNEIKGKKFLLGTGYLTNGKPNLIGYCLLKNSFGKLYSKIIEKSKINQ